MKERIEEIFADLDRLQKEFLGENLEKLVSVPFDGPANTTAVRSIGGLLSTSLDSTPLTDGTTNVASSSNP